MTEPTAEDLARDLPDLLARAEEAAAYVVSLGLPMPPESVEADFILALRRAVFAEAEVERLRAENASLVLSIAGRDKAYQLLNAGFESACEVLHELKQRVRVLEAQVAPLRLIPDEPLGEIDNG